MTSKKPIGQLVGKPAIGKDLDVWCTVLTTT